jgi:hypothetical protein
MISHSHISFDALRYAVEIDDWAFSGFAIVRHIECEVSSQLEIIGAEAFARSGLGLLPLATSFDHAD